MAISAIVMPFEFVTMARWLRTWPRKLTKTVTNESSMVLANAAQSRDAVDGVRGPLSMMCLP